MIKIFKNSTDISAKLESGLEEQELQLNTGDTLLIGFYKQINTLYFSFKTANTVANTLTIQRSTAAGYESATIIDKTRGLTKSNFIFIPESSTHASKTENSLSLYWIKITVGANSSAMVLRLLDLVYASEDDLVVISKDINRFYPDLMASHILSLVEARDNTVRRLNNSGIVKYNGVEAKKLTHWDVREISDVSKANAHWAVASIYRELQDAAGDAYKQKADYHEAKGDEFFKVFEDTILNIDLNDNGTSDEQEAEPTLFRFYK